MLIVACVETGNYLSRGVEYVAKLNAAVARHLSEPHVFRVYTDDQLRHWPTLQRTGLEINVIKPLEGGGWWNKLHLFSPKAFAPGDRVLYFDLDTLIVDSIDELAGASGILHLGKWGWQKNDYGSGVMVWRHGEHAEAWSSFSGKVPRKFRGDQDWLTHLGGWAALPDGACVSYRYHCEKAGGPPTGASVVCFHGKPKPHEVKGWVETAWA